MVRRSKVPNRNVGAKNRNVEVKLNVLKNENEKEGGEVHFEGPSVA